MKEISNKINFKALEYINLPMDSNMKDILRMVWNVDLVKNKNLLILFTKQKVIFSRDNNFLI